MRAVVAEDAPDRPRIVGRDERPTPRTGPDDIVTALETAARAACRAAGIALRDVTAVGCAAPGPLDHRTGVVHVAPNLVGVRDLALGERLASALDGARTFVDRDTSAALVAEVLAGAARGARDAVYVTVSTGLGGAILSGGHVLRGVTATAGEIGHWPVGLEGPRCGCGSYGCAESFAAGRNLAEQLGVDDASQVYRAALVEKDPTACWLLDRADEALGNLAVGLVNVLNPSVIVVGGSIAEHQPEHVFGPMRGAIAARAFATPAAAVRVVPAELGSDVGMLGAVLVARERAAGRDAWFV